MLSTSLYFLSYATSLLGNSIATVLLPVLVLATTGEPLMAGLVALAGGASTVIFGLLTGPLIDRADKRLVAGAADVISAASIGMLAVVATWGNLHPGWFILSAFLSGIGDMPAWNAREAMIYGVQRHSRASLERLVGVRESVSALVIVVGPTVAGLLMQFCQPHQILWVTFATSLLAGVMVLVAPAAFGRPPEQTTQDTSNRAGWRYLRAAENRALRTLIGLNIASVAVVTALQSLMIPVVMVDNNTAEASGYALAAIGLGLLLGGVLYAALGTRLQPWPLVVVSSLLNVSALAVLTFFLSLPFILVMCFVFGLTSAAAGAVTGVLSLQLTAEDMRGRINSLQNTASMVVGPISVFLLSWLMSATSIGVTSALLVVGWAAANAIVLVNLRGSVPTSHRLA